jgi:NAD(P)-dependent dehydrogenase (short-subunit alcohol dehydrogenase family)
VYDIFALGERIGQVRGGSRGRNGSRRRAAPLDEPDTEEILEYSCSRTPFPRLGDPEDIARAAVWVASDECSFVSGTNVLVDGGWIAYEHG